MGITIDPPSQSRKSKNNINKSSKNVKGDNKKYDFGLDRMAEKNSHGYTHIYIYLTDYK